jgi:hypothetical protein
MKIGAARRPHVLLCSEAGGGRGHATKLATLARALWPEPTFQAILPRLDPADLLRPFCDRVDLGHYIDRMPGAPNASVLSWGSWFQTRGFGDPDVLLGRFDWWCEALRTIQPDLVVADFGPTALLAARAMGIRTVSTGATFVTPPSALEHFPEYLTPAQAAAHGTELSDAPLPDEGAMRDCINDTLGPRGLPPMARLAQVYAADLEMPCGVSLWDPYASWRDRPLVAPIDPTPPLQERAGSEVFIYFSTAELKDAATCEALRRLTFPARLVAPGISPELARDLASNPHLTIEPAPWPHARIVARARVIVCAGQAGTLALAVLAGIPVLALPVQLEQFSNALRASGALRSVRVLPSRTRSTKAILDMIAELWSQRSLTDDARENAVRLRGAYPESAQDSYRRLVLPLLGHAEERRPYPAVDAR